MDKICLNCLQPWPGCVCVIPLRPRPRQSTPDRPRPHPVLSRQLMGPLLNPVRLAQISQITLQDPPKEFCPDCHLLWPSCKCAGRRI